MASFSASSRPRPPLHLQPDAREGEWERGVGGGSGGRATAVMTEREREMITAEVPKYKYQTSYFQFNLHEI